MIAKNGKLLRLSRGDDEQFPQNLSESVSTACNKFFERRKMPRNHSMKFGRGFKKPEK